MWVRKAYGDIFPGRKMNQILNVRLAQKREDCRYHRDIPSLTVASKQGLIVLVFNSLVLKHLLLFFSRLWCFSWCFHAFKMWPAILIILHHNFCQCVCMAKRFTLTFICFVLSKEWLTWLLHNQQFCCPHLQNFSNPSKRL